MKTRLLILGTFTLITLSISLLHLEYGEDFPWFFGLSTVALVYGIGKIIVNHRRFKLVDNTLVIEEFFARALNLHTVAEWRELGHYIRGQRQLTIILLFNNDEKVIVDNSEYHAEFNELLTYLSKNHGQLKQEGDSRSS